MTLIDEPLQGDSSASTFQAALEGLPSLYSEYIHVTRYARWSDDSGRRETWVESVDRYINFLVGQASKNGYELEPDELEFIRFSVINTEAMCSMRALMTAGPAAERDNIAIYNCHRGDTKILTIDGSRPIKELVGTDAIVLDGNGNWTPSPVRSFGTQKLVQITFRPGVRSVTKLRHVIESTPDHRWITVNRGEVTDLKVGDIVPFVGAASYARIDEAWVRGFGFGDGTIHHQGHGMIRLCGEKAEHLELVASVGGGSTCYPPSANGDPIHNFHKGVMDNWKELPYGEEPAYLASWLEGYLAADGHQGRLDSIGLSSQDADAIEFVKEVAPYAGYAITGQSRQANMETNFGRRAAPLQVLTLRREVEFKVVSIEDLGVEEEVYCATVPTTGSFVLEHGILTGNCTYLVVDDPRAFDEAMYLLMCGTGVGFSVERQYVGKLPEVPDQLFEIDDVIVVDDNRKSWAGSYRRLLATLWAGHIPKWDTSRLRPAGQRLKTFGGRSSGPGPLEDLFRYTIDIFRGARGNRLSSLEAHGLMCKIGDIVVAGGVRRSAMISLSNPSDDRMRDAKSGNWHATSPHYALANNSAVWTEKPDAGRFLREWTALYESKSGERGIVNREALREQVRRTGRRDPDHEFGVNPCGEIILRPQECCNLTEIVARYDDTLDDLKRKAAAATIMGTIQATCTDFDYVRPIWRKNCEEERLLGVSITGRMDHPVLAKRDKQSDEWLHALEMVCLETNEDWAERLGIPMSASITCQKPSGTVSQLVDAASGGHTRYAPYYVRRTRDSKLDPVAEVVRMAGVPCEQDTYKPENWVFEWPVKAPEGSLVNEDDTALEQLERWLQFKLNFCEHNPSCTIHVKEDEWLAVGAWVFDHFDEIGGLAFLPAEGGHGYSQLPYEEIGKAEYEQRVAAMPKNINWAMLSSMEHEDNTTGSRELSCSAGACDMPDDPRP